MNRRDTVLALLAVGATFGPLGGKAQQSVAKRRIGWLTTNSAEFVKPFLPIIREQLRRVGYEEGRNLAVEWRYAEGNIDRLPGLAEDLVRQHVELIVANGNEPCIALMRATSTLPIVLFAGVAPVEIGLVKSLSRPGGNVTGTTFNSPEMAGKTLELLKEAVPRARRVAVLWNPSYPGMRFYADESERAANTVGVVRQRFAVARADEIPAALQRIAANSPDVLFVANDSVVASRISEIAAFALKHKLPSIGTAANFVNAGGMLYYGPDILKIIERTMSYVDRILRGAKPGELPIEQPTKFELVINLKTAKALGLTIPQSILFRADRVIE